MRNSQQKFLDDFFTFLSQNPYRSSGCCRSGPCGSSSRGTTCRSCGGGSGTSCVGHHCEGGSSGPAQGYTGTRVGTATGADVDPAWQCVLGGRTADRIHVPATRNSGLEQGLRV